MVGSWLLTVNDNIQFELHVKDFVDIRKVPDMPPEARRHEYLYQPCDLIPPVGENLMAHFFHHPEEANDRSVTCLRAPKKRPDKLVICPQRGTRVGWGIQMVEGWIASRIWLLGLGLFMVGSPCFWYLLVGPSEGCARGFWSIGVDDWIGWFGGGSRSNIFRLIRYMLV